MLGHLLRHSSVTCKALSSHGCHAYRGGRSRARRVVLGLVCVMFIVAATAIAGSGAGTKTVAPTEINDPLVNPYMGWGIWAAPRVLGYYRDAYSLESNTTGFGDDAPLFRWVMLDWDWARLEPQEGQYNWSEFDKVVTYWAARHKQFIVRLWVTDDPGWAGIADHASVCPNWLWQKGVHYREYAGEGNIKQREPDYLDPSFRNIYMPAFSKLLAAFAARYDQSDTPVMFVHVMGYGNWADWATWYSQYPWPNDRVKHETLARIVQLYAGTFRHTRMLMDYMDDWDSDKVQTLDDHLYRMALDVGLAHGTGLFDTGFIQGINTQPWMYGTMMKYWQDHPMIGEGWSYTEIKKDGTHGTIEENLRVALQYHCNCFHWYSDDQGYQLSMREDRTFFERGLQSGGLGYRLVLTSATWPKELAPGQLLVLDQTWVNRNVGRLFVRYPLRLYLTDVAGSTQYSETDRAFDATHWVQGQSYVYASIFHLPTDLKPGEYDIRIALVDAAGKLEINPEGRGPGEFHRRIAFGNPRIRLAIAGVDSEMRYKLGTLRILAGNGQ